jgi:hypothetical protein
MKKNYFLMIFAAMLMLWTSTAFGQGSTTSGVNGKVNGANGETLPGATVMIVDVNSGTTYGTVTDLDGLYRIPNMNVGGPYKLTISFVGYENYEQQNIYLTLGQTLKVNVQLNETSVQLEGAEIYGQRSDIFDGNRTGAETVVGSDMISTLPTVNRNLTDFTRMTPQARVSGDGSITIAGMNNRYNAISIDGAVNNDVFGLAASGTNGGQTGGTPISMDAIDQFQIVLAPFDVRQGGFAGASINAVTRRGSNDFEGSAYYIMRNESIAGKTPYGVYEGQEDFERAKLPDFSSNLGGLRIGGPIIKNKLFFFLNAEMQRDNTPKPFDFSNYDGDSDLDAINAFADQLRSEYGYDPGGFLNNEEELKSDKFLVRLDWNISDNHKLMLRHHYTKHENYSPSSSSNRSISFYNNGVYFPSTTNSTALELKSNWQKFSNNLILGYTNVFDDRDPMGTNFPSIQVYDGAATIYAGAETFSTGNQLKQNILSITDNFNIYKGKHTITVGVNFEYSHTYNLFIRQNYGEYRFNSLPDFMAGMNAIQYDRSYSLVDDITGDGSAAAADFNMFTAGVYGQDEFQVNDDFKLTFGLRIDVPMFLTEPPTAPDWETTKGDILAEGWDLEGAEAGQMPKNQFMFSPRIGFNYDISGEEKTQLRGGIGLFTSRLPLVWPGGSYTNSGAIVGGVSVKNDTTGIVFIPEWDQQYTAEDFGQTVAVPSGQLDLFTENFKFPQVLRASVAIDHKLPWWGLIGTFEGIFTKTLNNMVYYNVNNFMSDGNLVGADDRPHYDGKKIDARYSRIIMGSNTNEGFTYDLSVQLQKPIQKGFSGSIAYSYGVAKALNDATSSQNSSQWRYMESVNGLNHLDLSYSDFDRGHRVVGFLSYKADYADHFATTVTLFYDGHSGQRYSYVYNDRGRLNGEGENPGNLIWVPESSDQINLVDIKDKDGNVVKTTAQQWTDLEQFINDDKYLSDHKGGYAERNGARLPFESILDLKLAQDFYINAGSQKHTLQVTFDLFNLGNLFNEEWGEIRYITNDAYQLITWVKNETVEGGWAPQYQFSKPTKDIWNVDDSGVRSSRWQGQIGIRYIFGRP